MRRLVTGIYYLALGAWLGALVMLATGAAATFQTVRATQAHLSADQQNRLAGSIVGNSITGLGVIQISCAAAAVVCVLLQCTIWKRFLAGKPANSVRLALLAVIVLAMGADRAIVDPALREQRAAMWAGDSPAAKMEFDRLHQLSVRLTSTNMFLLAAAVLVSPFALTRKDDGENR